MAVEYPKADPLTDMLSVPVEAVLLCSPLEIVAASYETKSVRVERCRDPDVIDACRLRPYALPLLHTAAVSDTHIVAWQAEFPEPEPRLWSVFPYSTPKIVILAVPAIGRFKACADDKSDESKESR
eukprot:321749-Rhodomonas_salina.5